MNPVLPIKSFVPDGEGRWMPDGRFYVYGSFDISGAKDFFCSNVLHVFSTDNLISWVDHGVCLEAKDITWSPESTLLYAPDCIYKDGVYYLYFCTNDGREGVAFSDTPYGYFQNPTPIEYADKDGIDPAVFIDDDEQVYYFWGQFHLKGARMKPDMFSLDLTTLNSCIIDEKRHGFHEGASIRKKDGRYYLVYTDTARGKATCLSYAVASSPLGPYEKKGTIVDNIYCDPETWNNHGSIAEYKGQWYVIYHRSSQKSMFNRRMCMEPIYFDEHGDIKEVVMTTQGIESPLSMNQVISAASACILRNGPYITPVSKGEFEVLSHIGNNSFAVYRYIDFQNPLSFHVTISSKTSKGEIEIWADDELLGICEINETGGWENWRKFECSVKPVTGIKTVYLVFRGSTKGMGNRLMEVKEFYFLT
jgi:arabinoxylan arabinofuranohydrolase